MVDIAIISFVNYKRGQNRALMNSVMKYTMRENKTSFREQSLVTGIGCTPESACADFMNTKILHGKDDGRMFYHMVQSFPSGVGLNPITVHRMAVELADHFKGHEVLVSTHIERKHMHSHFIINSVHSETGKKLHISTPDLDPIRKLNDELCIKYNLPVFEKPESKKVFERISDVEYQAAANGESWKFRLMNAIDDCMRYASDREDFISLMRSEGYDVKWTDTRKNITYTTPEGMKCRDAKLHDDRYLKSNMELEFDLRAHRKYPAQTKDTGWEDERKTQQPSYQPPVPVQVPSPHKSRKLTNLVLSCADNLARGIDYDDGLQVVTALAEAVVLSVIGAYRLIEIIADMDHDSLDDDKLKEILDELRQEPENRFGYRPPEQSFEMTMM